MFLQSSQRCPAPFASFVARMVSEASDEQGKACNRREPSDGSTDGLVVSRSCHADQEPKANTDGVQHSSRHHKAGSIYNSWGIQRHLRAMCVTVENSEETNHRHCHGNRSFNAEGDENTKHDHRECNTNIDGSNRYRCGPEKATNDHKANKGQRDEPQRPSPELVSEKANKDHSELMVQAAERMHEAVHEPARVANSSVGESGSRSETERLRRQLHIPFHGQAFFPRM